MISSFWLLALALPAAAAAAGERGSRDPLFAKQWAIHNDGTQEVSIDLDNLHSIRQRGIPGVDIGWREAQAELSARARTKTLVAVIDSGVDPTHPDLVGRLSPLGRDILDPQTPVSDPRGHGTHVAGLIVAQADNGQGIAGVAPASVKVLPIRLLSDRFRNFAYRGRLISEYAADAIRYAVEQRASVINMSFGWPALADTSAAREAVREAVAAGILVVAAAGNDRKDSATFPCAYEGVLCVGAVSNQGQPSLYSNHGGLVDLLAPGDQIISTFPISLESRSLRIRGYEQLSGTSQAAPIVAGVAATLRSVYPEMSLDELKARLLVSARERPTDAAALYGLVRLPEALAARAQPVFLPELKQKREVTIDEARLEARGVVPVQVLWADAGGVEGQVEINGRPAGSARVRKLARGARIEIPWSYRFDSLDDDSRLRMTIRIRDASGHARAYFGELRALRPVSAVGAPESSVNGLPAEWVGSVNGLRYSRLGTVSVYGGSSALPQYYQVLSIDARGATIRLFRPGEARGASSIATVQAPGLTEVSQLIRLDLDGDGRREWLITGYARNQGRSMFQFHFLDSELRPLPGDAATWQIPLESADKSFLVRDYAKATAWIAGGAGSALSRLPCFLMVGSLPAADAFSKLDARSAAKPQPHLFVLRPSAAAPSGGVRMLELRALDSASFRKSRADFVLRGLLPPGALEAREGRARLLFGTGIGLSAETGLWDVRSPGETSLLPAPGWSALSAGAHPLPIPPTDGSAFLSFFDSQRGSFAWSNPSGAFGGQTAFEFKSAENPLLGPLGAFEIPNRGRYWFLESRYDLVAGHHGAGAATEQRTIAIERDSSFPGAQFSELLAPVLVGSAADPRPGIYVDSTLVRGDSVSVVVWKDSGLARPLRYAFRIPSECAQLGPVRGAEGGFELPLLCEAPGGLSFRLIAAD